MLQQLFERAILISIAVEKIWRADDAIESVAGRSMHAKKEGSMARRAKSKYAAAGISEGHANKTVWLRLYHTGWYHKCVILFVWDAPIQYRH